MNEAKVLIVDDSAVMRRMLRDIISSQRGLTVSGEAANGAEAITELESRACDIVLLDLEMPVMDGISALRIMKDRWPKLPIVVFSSLALQGSAASVQALTLGAAECILKPKASDPTSARTEITGLLVPVTLALANGPAPAPASTPSHSAPAPRADRAPVKRPEAIVLASSTGGPAALLQLFASLGPVNVPVFLVQHMPATFTAQLAKRLSDHTGLEIREAEDGEIIRPGIIRIAPGGLHLEIHRERASIVTRLTSAPMVQHVRPSADPLFQTTAAAYDGRVLGVVLTGMGRDGTDGARAVVDAGGEVIVQDAETSVVWGMPGAVASEGLASEVLPLDDVPVAIKRRVGTLVHR